MDMRAFMETLGSAIDPLVKRVRLLVGKGTLHLVDDAPAVQTVQATFLAGETRDAVERSQDYGFTSHPLPGMQPIAVFIGGDRSNGIVLAVADRTYRLRGLARGEVAIYDDLGQRVHLTREGIIIETALDITVKAGPKLRLEADHIEMHAREKISFDIAGYGWHVRYLGGTTWESQTWQLGATMAPVAPLPINPPEGP
jgi:phage baseplate assembly protein V